MDTNGEIIRLSPPLAAAIGLNECLVLLQLQYLTVISDQEIDGEKWTYQTLGEMVEKYFPFLSESTVSRTIRSLETKNLIRVDNFNKAKFDRTQWFWVNLEECKKLPGFIIYQNEKSKQSKRKTARNKPSPDTILQNEISIPSECKIEPVTMQDACRQNETTIPETSAKTSRESSNEDGAKAAAIENGKKRDLLIAHLKKKLGVAKLAGAKRQRVIAVSLVKEYSVEMLIACFDELWAQRGRKSVDWVTVKGSIQQFAARGQPKKSETQTALVVLAAKGEYTDDLRNYLRNKNGNREIAGSNRSGEGHVGDVPVKSAVS